MADIKLNLSVLKGTYGIAQLDPQSSIPPWASQGEFFSITRSTEELSVVCLASAIPESVRSDQGWRIFKIQGPFAFDQVGILNAVTSVFAEKGIGLFAISTYDTDYILVKEDHLDHVIASLMDAGHQVIKP